MHLAASGQAARPCDTCGTVFTPKRAWSRFCKTGCRNAFHGREARVQAILEAAPRMFEALRAIAAGTADPSHLAAEAIKDLKAP